MKAVKAAAEKVDGRRAVLDKFNRETESVRNVIPKLRKELDENRKQVQEKYDLTRKIRADFKKVEDEYFAHLKEQKKKEEEEYKKERELRKVLNIYIYIYIY